MSIDYAGLADDALLDLLSTQEDLLPREAVDEILRRGASTGPALVRILQDDEAWETDGPRFWAVVHAAYLLATLRPPGSLDVLIDTVDRAEEYSVDWITEDSPEMLAAFGPAAVPALRAAARDRDAAPMVRIWMNAALGTLGRCCPEALDALRVAVDHARGDQDVRAAAAAELLHFALPGDRDRILAAADEDILEADAVEEVYRTGGPSPVPVHDWMSFYDPEEIQARQRETPEEDVEEAPDGEAPPPPLRAGPKVGRNEPCPCGSGKKSKKCCAR